MAGALGVVGVDGAVAPFGGGGGRGGGADAVGAGIEGEEGPLAGAAVFLDLDAFLAAFVPGDFDLAAAGAQRNFQGEGGGIFVGGIRADDAEGFAGGFEVVRAGLETADELAEAGEDAGGDRGCVGNWIAGAHPAARGDARAGREGLLAGRMHENGDREGAAWAWMANEMTD